MVHLVILYTQLLVVLVTWSVGPFCVKIYRKCHTNNLGARSVKIDYWTSPIFWQQSALHIAVLLVAALRVTAMYVAAHSAHCTLHTVRNAHSAHCTLHTVHTAHCTQCRLHTAHTAHCTQCSTHCTLHTVCTAHSAHCTLHTLHSVHTALSAQWVDAQK